ncbi:MAG: AAA family ATPase [Ardenticatenaceae bacterium]
MKIKSLFYHNQDLNWQLERTEFANLNLLVGASGVGKTRILEAILDVQRIANGASLSGVAWDIEFMIDGEVYRWEGAFENTRLSRNQTVRQAQGTASFPTIGGVDHNSKAPILHETLSYSQAKIVRRTGSEIVFQGQKVPVKLSVFESVVSLFHEDDGVKAIYHALTRGIFKTQFYSLTGGLFLIPEITEGIDLELLRQYNDNAFHKLAIAYYKAPEIFERIKQDFRDVFPNVEDVRVKLTPIEKVQRGYLTLEIPAGVRWLEIHFYIKEVGVEQLIHHNYVSSGMLKTLGFIANMHLCADGSVILIDEFENSLGVNCIDILNDLLLEERNLQYVITSHHPYIINNVPMDAWKIVTRAGSVVRVRNAEAFRLGDSKHQAFMQLMQLEEFTEGINVE